MKVTINYDFFDAIKDANEPMHPLKMIRNNKGKYLLLFPMSIAIRGIAIYTLNFENSLQAWVMYFTMVYGNSLGIDLLGELIARKIMRNERDYYAAKSIDRLRQLVMLLRELNVNTDYDLLLESELYSKEKELKKGERLLPSLMVKKYISVPSYNDFGEITDTSILQEHIIGTEKYTLSIGEPKKQYKHVLVKTPI